MAKPTRRPLAILLPNTMKMNRLLLGLLTAGLIATGSTSPAQTTTTTDKAVKLDAVEVLGSRIRRTDLEGPSPVSAYNQEYIRSSGAMTLADFLGQIPQSYTGIASGRGSARMSLIPISANGPKRLAQPTIWY